ncbi:hypothetical protein HD553DRAFT_5041 [Filobasidium floriforme]|uniref:uncharacterized protein n=1 Tax=Filobasidium floriforme TaxID=5210 RepID=UPI001E8D0189|nr:uncharacterized protein HD553DRAFT_5041 [Filobasidium floriforme]KAH8090424.1 hypothetical protein HD553DRAFT_5041 [Filobasidium floriforme]
MYLSVRSLRLCAGCKLEAWKFQVRKRSSTSSELPALDVIRSAWIRSFYSSLWFPSPFSPHTLAYTRARVSRLDLHHPSSEQKVDHPNLNSASAKHAATDWNVVWTERHRQPLLACCSPWDSGRAVSCSDSWAGKTDPSHHPRTFSRLRHPGYILRFFRSSFLFCICSVSILCRPIPFPPRTSFSALYHRSRRRRRANWTKS